MRITDKIKNAAENKTKQLQHELVNQANELLRYGIEKNWSLQKFKMIIDVLHDVFH